MTNVLRTFSLACLLTACGGSDGPNDSNTDDYSPEGDTLGGDTGNTSDSAVTTDAMGFANVELGPDMQIEVAADVWLTQANGDDVTVRMATGETKRVQLNTGPSGLGLDCDGHVWLATNHEHNWTTCDGSTPAEWTLELMVTNDADGTDVSVQVAHWLQGTWELEGSADPPETVCMNCTNGTCTTVNMPDYQFEVLGNIATVLSGECAGTEVSIEVKPDGGRRIEVNCGFSWTDVFIMVE
jgi:hypothetical protein